MPGNRNQFPKKSDPARNKLMQMDQIHGMSISELAEKYRIPEGVVREGLTDVQKSGFLQEIERGVFDTLMPKALAVLEKHLDETQSLKAVELTLALFGAVKSTIKATKSFEVNFPSDTRAMGIVALDEIRQERLLHAPKRQRHDSGPAVDDPGDETPDGDVPGKRREH
jgi:hypothetical protein